MNVSLTDYTSFNDRYYTNKLCQILISHIYIYIYIYIYIIIFLLSYLKSCLQITQVENIRKNSLQYLTVCLLLSKYILNRDTV